MFVVSRVLIAPFLPIARDKWDDLLTVGFMLSPTAT